jgi:flagellar motor switch protein FliG
MADDFRKSEDGARRAAAFLLSLDSDTAAGLMRQFNEREMAILSEEMTRMGSINAEQRHEVMAAYMAGAGGDIVAVEPLLEEMLTKALGRERAQQMLQRIKTQTRESEPFRSLRHLNHRQISTMLKGEHPQVQALVVAHLEPQVSIDVLKVMDDDARFEVIKRIATTDELPSELVRQVDDMMEVRAFEQAKNSSSDSASDRRYKTIALMLNFAEASVSKSIMDRMAKDLPSAANEIQALMFVFEDLAKIDDKQIQKILAEVDKADLTLALKTAAPEVKDKILKNLSTRARENMLEELSMLGPRPLTDVEAAQKRILEQVRAMEERGDIRINRGGGGDVMV